MFLARTPQQCTRVGHWKRDLCDVYIGRGSVWGNPFVYRGAAKDSQYTVTEVNDPISAYEDHVYDRLDLLLALPSLRGLTLGCWCVTLDDPAPPPERCHGHVLARLAHEWGGIAAFTGHRPDKLGGYGPSRLQALVKRALRQALFELSPSLCVTGMALGVDQWAAEICLELGIPFVAAVPFVGQESAWPRESQLHYAELLRQACHIEVVSPGAYAPEKMQIRNVWMTDHCNTLVAVWNGSGGGTSNCVTYARKIGREIFLINPRTL